MGTDWKRIPFGNEGFLYGKDMQLHQSFPLEREGVSGADG